MKKETFLNILRVLFCLVFAFLAIFVVFHPKRTQTNILQAILTNNAQDRLLSDLSEKHSGRFNVIFEADGADLGEISREFLSLVDKNVIKTDFSKNGRFARILDTYKYYSPNLLSMSTAKSLKEHNYENVKLESLERLYNPLGLNLLPVEKDPFLLFDDYIQSLSGPQAGGSVEFDGKNYEILTLSLPEEIALSPTLLNQEISKVKNIKNRLEKEHNGLKIYLSGAPVHTFYASSKSMVEINVICVLSSIFIILLCKFYFRSFKILIPIALSLSLGMVFGYLLTSALFDSIHILTFVFSTTLIGICVDYSLHFFAHDNDIDSVFKSLTLGMITTVFAFFTLLFSNISLLKQIAVFTSGGLVCVYLFVVLFYPLICKNIKPKSADFRFPELKINKIAAGVLILLCIAGLLRVKFNDDIKDMYVPPKHLVQAEKLYANLQGAQNSTSFIIVNGSNVQELLENEENITKYLNQDDFYSLSKFVPSIKRQKENSELIKDLYKHELNDYAGFLPVSQRKKLLNAPQFNDFLTLEKLNLPMLKDFLINDTTSVIILQKTPPEHLLNKILSDNPRAQLINLRDDISHRVEKCRHACMMLIIPAVLVLFGLLSFVYKPKNALKIILPSILGGTITISLLGLLGLPVNLFHVLALFLITGFSLDYAIFRFNFLNSPAPAKSGWAVLISCATTVFSFLLLAFTSFKLISSLGFVLAVGLVSSYLLSLVLIRKD